MAAMLNAPYSQRRSVLKMYPIRHDTHNRPARMNAVRTTSTDSNQRSGREERINTANQRDDQQDNERESHGLP